MASKGLIILNQPGTLDSDYRGPLLIMLHNIGPKKIDIPEKTRVAQGVLCPVFKAEFEVVEHLSETIRGEGGWGSTGS